MHTKNLQKNSMQKKKIELFNKFKLIRNRIVTMCRSSKKTYYKGFFYSNSSDIRKIWQGIKSIVNIKEKNNTFPDTLSIDNELIKDPEIISNSFNNYFSSIASKLQANFYPSKVDFSKYLKNRVRDDFIIPPTNKKEIKSIIDNISPSK